MDTYKILLATLVFSLGFQGFARNAKLDQATDYRRQSYGQYFREMHKLRLEQGGKVSPAQIQELQKKTIAVGESNFNYAFTENVFGLIDKYGARRMTPEEAKKVKAKERGKVGEIFTEANLNEDEATQEKTKKGKKNGKSYLGSQGSRKPANRNKGPALINNAPKELKFSGKKQSKKRRKKKSPAKK